MKLCINCKHHKPTYGLCVAPDNGVSPIDGAPKPAFATLERGTSTWAKCGPSAINFELKPPAELKKQSRFAFLAFWRTP